MHKVFTVNENFMQKFLFITKTINKRSGRNSGVRESLSPLSGFAATTSTMKNSKTLYVVAPILALAIAGGSFYGGMAYQKTQGGKTGAQAYGQNGRYGAGGGFGGGMRQRNGSMGTVTTMSATSISLTTRAGANVTYSIDSSTQILNQGATATVSDITTGATAMVQTASSSSTVATRIMLGGFGGGQSGAQQPGDSSGDPSTNQYQNSQ